MKEKEFVIRNKLGMHLKSAALFVKAASRFQCDVLVWKDGVEVNGKSIMGLLTLEAAQGARIKVRARGSDEDTALLELGALIEAKFDEE